MELLYNKISINRKKYYQIVTSIFKTENRIFVRKEGIWNSDHINHIFSMSKKLKKYYTNLLQDIDLKNNKIEYEFIQGKTLEEIFLKSLDINILRIYKNIVLSNLPLSEFKLTNDFIKIFGKQNILSAKCLPISNIDFTLSNIIKNENDYKLIDCEWVYEFPIPVDFIFYRAAKELFKNPIQKISFEEVLHLLGVNIDIAILKDMDDHFSSLVFSNDLTKFQKKENFIFNAIDNAQAEIERLNSRIDDLGSWGHSLDKEIAEKSKIIENSNKKNEEYKSELNDSYIALKKESLKNQNLNNSLSEKIEELNKINDKNKFLNESLICLDNENSILKKDLENKNNNILELNKNISSLNNEVNRIQENFDSINNINANLQTTITEKDCKINTLQNELSKNQLSINNFENKIIDLESNVNQLAQELKQIKTSTSYRFLLKYFKVRDFLLPPNTKRRLFVKLTIKFFAHPIWFLKHLNMNNIRKFFRYSKSEGADRTLERLNAFAQNNPIQNNQEFSLVLEDMTICKDFKSFVFPKFNKPLVSIVIPVYNQYSYTYGCLISILKQTKNIPYEIIIGDDCSNDETLNITKHFKNIKVARTKRNSRFLLNCNNAAKLAKGKYILFLNNDTNVQPNWLNSLVETINSDENIGMVGSKLVYPNGQLQEAGGILWKDGSAWNYGYKSDPQRSEYNYRKEVDYISGASIMITKKLREEIGGFDKRFVPAYCEDSDLAFEVRKHGYKVVYDPFSVVVHYEGISNGTDTNSGIKKYQINNSQKFYDKWKDVLSLHFNNAENVFQARDRSWNKKTLLMIDHYVPQYDKDAGSRTIFAYLKLYCALGYNVKFIGENFYKHEPYTNELEKLGVEILYGPYYANHWKEWLENCGQKIDVVFFNRPHITIKFIDDVKKLTPNAKYIYYGHDLHYVRIYGEYLIKKDKALLAESNKWKEIEHTIFNKVDEILYPSIKEINILSKENSELNVKVLQPYIYDIKPYKKYIFKNRKDLLFVGGFRHSPNFDGIMWFIDNAFQDILKKYPDIKLYIAGSFPPKELIDKQSDNIIVTGFISDEELEKLYSNVRLVVVPLRYGAGIKGKVIEAMANNVPVVTTSCGAEGILTDALIIDDTMSIIKDLYDDDKKLCNLSKKEYEFIVKEYSVESAKIKLKNDIMNFERKN